MTRTAKLISSIAMFGVLAACSADETDFREAAEGAAVEAAETAYPDLTATASCEDPASTDVGTTFECTVTFSDGDVVGGTAEIISDDEVEVTFGP